MNILQKMHDNFKRKRKFRLNHFIVTLMNNKELLT